MARHLSGIRNFGNWLQPLGVSLSDAFIPRSRNGAGRERPNGEATHEVPHCWTMVQGDQLSARHRAMLSKPVDPTGVYCCIKMYVRDLNLSQEPLFIASRLSAAAITTRSPSLVHAQMPLSTKQISTYSKLAELCSGKFELPRAAQALRKLIFDRTYAVYSLKWLEQSPRQFEIEPEGYGTMPYLPRKCWRLAAKFD